MTGAREAILGRVRAALPDVPAGEPAAWARAGDAEGAVAYARRSPLAGEALVARFAERVADFRATVSRVGAEEVAGAVAAVLERHGARRVVVPDGLPAAWVAPGIEAVAGDAGPATLDAVDGVLTTCAVAIAETGTIVLDAGPGQGPRRATLVPDLHVCVVPVAAIVGSVPEALERVAPAVRERRRPLTLISGPSATSDIELERVEGVHGPRRLEVLVVG